MSATSVHLRHPSSRRIIERTYGQHLEQGMITRLMHPSDFGQLLKPFVFLDLFDSDKLGAQPRPEMPLHPHSGIATVSVIIEGNSYFADPLNGNAGTLRYGGVEWNLAGRGIWHGQERAADTSARVQGFQLWLALPPELESSEPHNRFYEAQEIPQSGPAYLILGHYQGVHSPVRSPAGINYLLVRLAPGERWSYQPPAGHSLGWLAVAQGELLTEEAISTGEMVIFEPGEAPISLTASGTGDTVFVLGSAIAHPHPLHLSRHSVHTNAQALAAGLARIAELQQQLQAHAAKRTASGTIPILS